MTDRNVILPVTARDRSQYGAPSWAKFKIIFRKDSNYPDFRGTKFYRNEEVAKNALIKKDKLIQTTKEANLKPPVPPKKDKFLVKVGAPTKKNNVIKQKFKEVIGSKNVPETYKPTGVTKNLYRALITVDNKTVLSTEFGNEADAIKAVKDYRIKNPIKNPPPDLKTLDAQKKKRYLDKKIRQGDITTRGGIAEGGPFKGDVEVHKGHAGNIRGKQLITGDKVIRTPGVINQMMSGDEGTLAKNKFTDLDYKIEKAEEAIERIQKSNMSAAKKKKLLAAEDAKLIKYASQSDGYKVVRLSDGNEFRLPGRSLQTIDPFDFYPGMTEVEINKELRKYFTTDGKLKPLWTKQIKDKTIQAADVENIKTAKIFMENMNVSKQAGAAALEEFKTMYKNSPDGSALRTALDTEFKCADGCFIKVANKNPDRVSQKLIRLFRGEGFKSRSGPTIKEMAKTFNVSEAEAKKKLLSGQWFTSDPVAASSYTDKLGKTKYVDVTPREFLNFKKYVDRINKTKSLSGGERFAVGTGDKLSIIPRYKLDEFEKAGKLKSQRNIFKNWDLKSGYAERPPGVLTYDSVLGGFVDSANPGEVVGQNQLKTWAEDNPMKVEVGTELPKANKSVLKTVGRTLAKVGTPLPTALIDGYFINKQMDEGKSTAEIAKDPLNWLGLATMEPLTKIAGANTSGGLNAVLRLGLNPATIRGISRFAGLPGLAISTAMTAYDQYKKYQNEEGFVYNLFNKEGT